MTKIVTVLLVVVALALSACGGGSVSYPSNGTWSGSAEGAFVGGCTYSGGSNSFCGCALAVTEQQYPDDSQLPGSPDTGGQAAANNPTDFPSCAGK